MEDLLASTPCKVGDLVFLATITGKLVLLTIISKVLLFHTQECHLMLILTVIYHVLVSLLHSSSLTHLSLINLV